MLCQAPARHSLQARFTAIRHGEADSFKLLWKHCEAALSAMFHSSGSVWPESADEAPCMLASHETEKIGRPTTRKARAHSNLSAGEPSNQVQSDRRRPLRFEFVFAPPEASLGLKEMISEQFFRGPSMSLANGCNPKQLPRQGNLGRFASGSSDFNSDDVRFPCLFEKLLRPKQCGKMSWNAIEN